LLEIMRTFLGYCLNCRRPAIVGEFQIQGWQHRFNLCEGCVDRLKKQLSETSVGVSMEIYSHSGLGSREEVGSTKLAEGQ
jgi:hypothetical protein